MGAEAGDARARRIGERLAEVYRRIGERAMRDLPVYNRAIAVEAVGFRVHDGYALGILITPWFMNVVMAPLGPCHCNSPHAGASIRHGLPSADLDFIVGELDGFGRIDTCSLFSPMFAFADADAARATAKAAMAALLDPNFASAAADHVARAAVPTPAIDRRRFLHGKLGSSRS